MSSNNAFNYYPLKMDKLYYAVSRYDKRDDIPNLHYLCMVIFREYLETNIRFYLRSYFSRGYYYLDVGLWECWRKNNSIIYDFPSGHLSGFSLFNVSNILIDDLKVKSNDFYINLKKASIPISLAHIPYAEGVYIREDYYPECAVNTISKTISFHFTGDYFSTFHDINDYLYDHTRSFMEYVLCLDVHNGILTVDDAVKAAKDEFVLLYVKDEVDTNTKIHIHKLFSCFIDRTINIVINALLYLNSPVAEINRDGSNSQCNLFHVS